ncbi:MAG: hypothetical protein A2Z20_10040 [Bdellovibrionales bacterium RBG_16_40_8]|nr:MAG: hypothetical protein A2Z20_10040 [Bdellovibrionales bacterium RBG_16_40_8]
MNTKPRFEMRISTEGKGLVSGIAPDSPAGQWIRQNKLACAHADLEFTDPHLGRGGFGASSAQYLLTNIAVQVLKNPDQKENLKIESIWRAYRQMETISSEGLRLSGADLVGQYTGGLCVFQAEPFEAHAFNWPFAEEDVVLVSTGHKLSTHEHLRGLKRVNTEELEWIYKRAMEAIIAHNVQAFYDNVNDYYAELLELGLVAENTQVLATSLLAKPFVHAAKGCGAMGSDVIAIFISKKSRPQLEKTLAALNLRAVTDTSQIDRGFHE